MSSIEYKAKDISGLTDKEFGLALPGDTALGIPPLTPPELQADTQYQDREEQGEAEYQEEADMTDEEFEKFLIEKFPDYPRGTLEVFEKIGVENWWDAGLPDVVHEPTELERAFALRLFVYEEKCFIRLGFVKEARESETSIKLRLRFVPAGRLPTEGPTELSVWVDKDENLKTIPEILWTGQQMLHFRPEYVEQVLEGWHQEWMV
jgi:hypothetical protein